MKNGLGRGLDRVGLEPFDRDIREDIAQCGFSPDIIEGVEDGLEQILDHPFHDPINSHVFLEREAIPVLNRLGYLAQRITGRALHVLPRPQQNDDRYREESEDYADSLSHSYPLPDSGGGPATSLLLERRRRHASSEAGEFRMIAYRRLRENKRHAWQRSG